MRVLRIPPAIVFTVVVAACDGGKAPPRDAIADGSGECSVFCIPDPASDAGTCPQNPPCAEPPDFTCPAGCRPVG